LSRDERAEGVRELVDGFGAPNVGRVEDAVALTLHAWVAAFEASGRLLNVLGNFAEDGLLSLPGLSVRSILPLFSGDGVRVFLSPTGPGDSVDALRVWVKLLSRMEPVPELFRGAIAGRYGNAGGLERSVYSMGGIDPAPSHDVDALGSFCDRGTPWGGGVGASLSDESEARLSFDSLRLFFSASNRSTRSLHCSSNWRSDSISALSVSDAGR